MKTLAALLTIALASCAEYPLTGTISYRDPDSGAKGGLVFRPGERPAARVRVPYYGSSGELLGMLDAEISRKPQIIPEK